jgi:hypothetical protein
MSSETYLGVPWMFRLDCTVSESAALDVEWTSEASEAGGNVSDYGWYNPTQYEVVGIITSTPMQSVYHPLGRRSRQDAVQQLEKITKERQELWLVSPNWVKKVVITSFSAKHDQPGGAAFEISISLQTVERAEFLVTTLPVAPDVAPPAEVCACPDTGSAAATAGAQTPVDVSGASDVPPSFLYKEAVVKGDSSWASVYPASTDVAAGELSPGGLLDNVPEAPRP